MIGNKCLLDTSIIIHAFKSKNEVSEKLDTMEEVFIPATAIGELYFGAYNSLNPEKHVKQIGGFLSNCQILQTDVSTAETYGTIKAALAKKGNPIPENDIWIAAISLQYNLPLYTSDEHFSHIDGIDLV